MTQLSLIASVRDLLAYMFPEAVSFSLVTGLASQIVAEGGPTFSSVIKTLIYVGVMCSFLYPLDMGRACVTILCHLL